MKTKCKTCKSPFSRPGLGHKFCSKSCAARYNNKIRKLPKDEYSKTKKCKCSKCSVNLRINKYAAIQFAKCKNCLKRPLLPARQFLYILKECSNCGDTFKTYTKDRKCCSRDCSEELKAGARRAIMKETLRRWEAGKRVTLHHGVLRSIRKLLIQRAKNSCSKCGWSKINKATGKVPLELHHRSGDHTDNSPSNLQILCPNCHALTPSFRSLNKGHGRPR